MRRGCVDSGRVSWMSTITIRPMRCGGRSNLACFLVVSCSEVPGSQARTRTLARDRADRSVPTCSTAAVQGIQGTMSMTTRSYMTRNSAVTPLSAGAAGEPARRTRVFVGVATVALLGLFSLACTEAGPTEPTPVDGDTVVGGGTQAASLADQIQGTFSGQFQNPSISISDYRITVTRIDDTSATIAPASGSSSSTFVVNLESSVSGSVTAIALKAPSDILDNNGTFVAETGGLSYAYFPVFTDLSTAVERSGSAPGLGPSEWDEQWPTSVSGAASVRRACRVLAEGPI